MKPAERLHDYERQLRSIVYAELSPRRAINSVDQNAVAEDFCFTLNLLAQSFSDANRRRVIRINTTDDMVLIKLSKGVIQCAPRTFVA